MSDDWQAGDLALCVWGDGDPIKEGVAYRVFRVLTRVEWSDGDVDVGLVVEGVKHPCNKDGEFWHGCFRKIRPDTEPCEEEFVTLLKRMKPAKVQS